MLLLLATASGGCLVVLLFLVFLAVLIAPAIRRMFVSPRAAEFARWQKLELVLNTPPPRDVRFRPHYMARSLAPLVLVGLFFTSPSVGHLPTLMNLKLRGVDGEGTVTSRCSELNGPTGPITYRHLSYRYSLGSIPFVKRDGVASTVVFRSARVGGTVPITYLAKEPAISAAIPHEDITIPYLFYFSGGFWLGSAFVVMLLIQFRQGVRRSAAKQFHLARWGVLVYAEVTDSTRQRARLRFAVGDRHYESERPLRFVPEIGECIPLLYDPRNPEINEKLNLDNIDFCAPSV